MLIRIISRFAALGVAVLLVACSQSALPVQQISQNGTVVQDLQTLQWCLLPTRKPVKTVATITFYGWPDNTPPGNAIAYPVIHQVASGDGTYCNPTTFATEPSNNKIIPYGTRIYVPFIKQYYIREDDCTPSGPPVGNGNNGCYKLWFDLWVGGDGKSATSEVVDCENTLTPNGEVPVIINPPRDLPVAFPGPLYRDKPRVEGTCDGRPG